LALAGIWAAVGYRLSRYRLLGVPLDLASVLAAGAAAFYALVRAALGRGWALHPTLAAVLIVWCAAVLGLRRRSFIFFRPGQMAPAGQPLEPLCPVALHASGFFAVNAQQRYFVEAEGQFESTALGDRIIAVVVKPVSLLGLLGSSDVEWGCWYAFFRPEELKEVTPGDLFFGHRPHPALRLRRAGKGERHLTLWLSFADRETRDRVAADLTSQVHPS